MLGGLGQSSYPGLERWAVLINARPRRRGKMAKKAVEVLDKALKASFYATTDEAQAGARWMGGLAVVAVGGLFAVFAAISRKGRGAARVVKEGYGATDSTVDALLA